MTNRRHRSAAKKIVHIALAVAMLFRTVGVEDCVSSCTGVARHAARPLATGLNDLEHDKKPVGIKSGCVYGCECDEQSPTKYVWVCEYLSKD